MTTEIETKLSELEGRVDYLHPHNEIIISDGKKKIKYRADIWGLERLNNCLFAYCLLRKYQLNTPEKCKGWKQWMRKVVDVTKSEETLVWSIYSSFSIFGSVDRSLVLYNYSNGPEISEDYRRGLKGNAANQGIALTDKLLDLAFGPIEQILLKNYKELNKYVKGGNT